jgi:small subunit ribosomal protein S25e
MVSQSQRLHHYMLSLRTSLTCHHRRPQQPLVARSKRRSGRKERVCRHSKLPPEWCFSNASIAIRIGLLTFTPHFSVKDKANHAVVLDKATSDKLNKDVQSYRLITVAVLVDRLKINGSLARKALHDLEEKGQIKKVVGHSRGSIYTRAVAGGD